MAELIISISYNHENAPVEFRDKIALDDSESMQFMESAMGGPSQIRELATLSTCNRTEVYGVLKEPSNYFNWVAMRFMEIKNVDIKAEPKDPTILYNREAVQHLMSVAGGLKSMMLGENQILSQVKDSYQLLLSSSYQTPVLNRLFQDAIRVGKSIRTKTALCEGAVSISMAAAELACKIYSNFSKHTVLVIGAGETAELVSFHFNKLGVNQFIIANRGKKRRESLSSKYGALSIPLEEIPQKLREVDIVVTATKSPTYLVTSEIMIPALKGRDYRSILVIDISTPRNVDPEIKSLPEVFLYNIDDLKQVVAKNLEMRKKQIPEAQAIVNEIANEYLEWYKNLEIVPTISKLAGYFEHIRNQELKKYVHKASKKEYKHLEELSKSIMRKLLHYPISELRKQNSKGNLHIAKIDVLWDLFHLRKFEENNE